MKNGKNPTLKQKIAMKSIGLVSENWLVYKVDHKKSLLHITHRNTGTIKVIPA